MVLDSKGLMGTVHTGQILEEALPGRTWGRGMGFGRIWPEIRCRA